MDVEAVLQDIWCAQKASVQRDREQSLPSLWLHFTLTTRDSADNVASPFTVLLLCYGACYALALQQGNLKSVILFILSVI